MLHASHIPPSLPTSRRVDTQRATSKDATMPGRFATRAGIMGLILQGAAIEGIHCDPGIEGNTDHSTPPSWDGNGTVITEAHEEPIDYNPDLDPLVGGDDSAFS